MPSSICKVTEISTNESLPAQKRFRVETRDKELQKVSLAPYRIESKKIFAILRRYSDLVEKASCDEAYIDLTSKINE
jgi:impB/mucB/samB family